jgi:trk system potassium uptake protein TrkA
MSVFGHDEPEARRILIAGGGHVGQFLARLIQAEHPGVTVKIVEANKAQAERVALALPAIVVLNGDALDPEILKEANVAATEAIVTVTNDDEANVLAALLAKRNGCDRAVTLVNNVNYAALVRTLGVDVVVSPQTITVSTILQHVRRGRIRAVHALPQGIGEIMEVELLETSTIAGRSIREAGLPDGVLIGAVVRGGDVLIPRASTTLRTGDRIVMFVAAAAIKNVERLFSVRLEYF